MKRTWAALVLCGASAMAGVQNPSGEHGVGAGDFFKKNGGIETWYYSLILDNGSKAYVSFTMAKGKFYPEISLLGMNGNYSQGREFEAKDVVENRGALSILRDGKTNRFQMKGLPGNGHHLSYLSDKDRGVNLEVDFSSCQASSVPNGAFNVNGQGFGQAILMSNCRFKGSLKVGSNVQNLSGSAYMDHTWQSKAPDDLATQGMQFQTFGRGVSGRVFVAQGGGFFGYAVEKGRVVYPNKWTAGGSPVSKSKSPSGNLDLGFSSGSSIGFTRRDQQSYDPSVNAGGWVAQQAFKALVGSIKIYRGSNKSTDGDWMHYSILGL